MKKKKLLIVAETMEGGVRRHVIDLVNGLDKDIFSIHLIYGNRVDSAFLREIEFLKNFAELTKLDSLDREINPKKDLKSFLSLRGIMKKNEPDIVHCHSSKAGVLGRLAAKSLNIKKVFYTPHAYSFQSEEFSSLKKYLFIAIEKILSKRMTTATFNVSQGEKDEALLYKIDCHDKFKVIYNGIPDIYLPDKSLLRKELGLPERCFVIGNNSRLSEQKNPLSFMAIAEKVIKMNSNIHFVYVGDGPLYDKCAEFINMNKLNSNIHLLGYREDSEFIVKAYDLFMITSRYEGLPYSLIESLRASVPILGFSVTGVKEIVSKENGLLIADEQEASDAILGFYNYMSFSKKIIYSQFQNTFSLEKMIKEIYSLYMS